MCSYKNTFKVCVRFFVGSLPYVRLIQRSWPCPSVSLKFWKQHTRQCRGPLKVALSVQKALQESDTETSELLGGTKGEHFLLNEGWGRNHDPPWVLTKRQTRINIVTRSGPYQPGSVAVYECFPGYKLLPISAGKKVCRRGTWEGKAPTCGKHNRHSGEIHPSPCKLSAGLTSFLRFFKGFW